MWFVCYEVHGRTEFNVFDNEEDAKKCYETDKEYYLKEWGEGNFKISLAKMKSCYS